MLLWYSWFFNYWQKRSTDGKSQDRRSRASFFHHSRSKGFLFLASFRYWYSKISWRLLQVNITQKWKFLASRVEQWKDHDERKLCELHLEEKAMEVFQQWEVHFVNGLCQMPSCGWCWANVFRYKQHRKVYPWRKNTVIAVSTHSREQTV